MIKEIIIVVLLLVVGYDEYRLYENQKVFDKINFELIPAAMNRSYFYGYTDGCKRPNDFILFTITGYKYKSVVYINECGGQYELVNGKAVPVNYREILTEKR